MDTLLFGAPVVYKRLHVNVENHKNNVIERATLVGEGQACDCEVVFVFLQQQCLNWVKAYLKQGESGVRPSVKQRSQEVCDEMVL